MPALFNLGLSAASTPPAFNTITPSYVTIQNESIAWRNLSSGPNTEYPVIFLNHFRGTMNSIDPLLASSIAESGRDFISLDNLGVGYSSGTVPEDIDVAAELVIDFITTLNVAKVNLLGFSYGGMLGQIIAEKKPEILNSVILAGTQQGQMEDTVYGSQEMYELSAADPGTPEVITQVFFDPSNSASVQAGVEWLGRVTTRSDNDTVFLTGPPVQAQYISWRNFIKSPARLSGFQNGSFPVLVANGDTDKLLPTANSFVLQREIPTAQLHIYPYAGHGFLYQHPVQFAKQIDLFLRSPLRM